MDSEVEKTAVNAGTEIRKCPGCGANMVWSPEKGCLYCEHCGTERLVDSEHAAELAFERLLGSDDGWRNETHVFRCENCGATQVFARGEFAVACSFCGAGNVIETHDMPGLRPNAVIPFEQSEEAAKGFAEKWAKKRIFAPHAFKKAIRTDEMNGVYSPAFTFDTDTVSRYSGTLAEYYYTTKRNDDGTVEQERHVRYFNISGVYDRSFNDILVQASSTIRQKTIDKLGPFATDHSLEYRSEFLSGFSANTYARDGLSCWQEAKSRIHATVQREILSMYSYDEVQSFSVSTECNDITYKYMLLPVWVGKFSFRRKLYNFFVNGRTGKVTGKTPVSPLRVALAVLLGLGAVVGLVCAVWFGLLN